MKFKKLLTLAVALSLSGAGAAGTLAGTSITNQANASFTIGGSSQTTNSTVATTTVNPVPSYTITTNGTEGTPAYDSTVATGSTVTYGSYTITNSGNTFIQVNLGATYGTGSSAISTVKLNGTSVTTVAAGSTPTSTTTTTTIAPGGTLTLTETFTAPSTPGIYYTDPVGISINYTNSAVDAQNVQLTTAPTSMDVSNKAMADTGNVNKTTVTTTTPVLGGPDTNTGDGSTITNPTTPTVIPTPGTGGPSNTTTGTGSGAAGSGNGPGESSGPGYTTTQAGPGGSGAPVIVDGTNQYIFPKADTETSTTDSVTMTASVGNPNPISTDYVLNPGSNYTYDSATGVFTGNAGTPAAGTTVTFKDANGTTLTGGTTGPSLTVPTKSTANYQTVITYPDTESATAKTSPITVPVTVNGAGPANFTVMPPNVTFGNSNGGTGVNTTARDVSLAQPSAVTCVVYPMDVANTGTYAEAYTLTASTNVPSGSIKYVASIPTTTTSAGVMSAADCATVTSTAAITATNVITAGTEQTVYAIVSVPAGRTAGAYSINQQVTGKYSGTVKAFNTDTVTVTAISGSGLTITKTVDNATANPGDTLTYTITATNNYTSSIYGLIVKDPSTGAGTTTGSAAYSASNLFGTSGFVTPTSLTATKTGVSGTILYRINGGSWSSTAPTVDASTTSIEVGVDTNGANGAAADGKIDANDVFPASAVLTVTLKGTVK